MQHSSSTINIRGKGQPTLVAQDGPSLTRMLQLLPLCRLRAWYPVAIVSQLDPSRPSAIQLLGRQMVAWHNPKTKL
jgi:hypothetical protein